MFGITMAAVRGGDFVAPGPNSFDFSDVGAVPHR